ncbi:MAG: hypothetical protein U9Q88_01515 [Bacillota bacterium]|nr:hypothetical protein [Bacillota bacterium]
MNENKNHFIKAIENILQDDTSLKIFLNGIKSIIPSRKRMIFLTILYLIIYFFYYNFIEYINGLESTLNMVNNVYIIVIPIFAIVITGYAIFQALTNGRTLLALLKANDNERNKFQEYNYFFFSISILYLAIIVANFLFSIILNILPKDWFLPYFTQNINNRIFCFFISIYIVFILNAIIEMKSFIYNLYQLFSSHAVASAIEQLKKGKRTD